MTRSDSTDAADRPTRRTFKQRLIWPGGLIAMIATIVCVDITMLIVASNDETFAVAQVDGDPSAAWNAHREQERRNAELGWDAALRVDLPLGRSPETVLELRDAAGLPLAEARVTLVAFHHARAAQRHRAVLVHDPEQPGTYRASMPITREGRWGFELECRLGGRTFTLAENQLIMLPAAAAVAAPPARPAGAEVTG